MTPDERYELVRAMGARDTWWARTPEQAIMPDQQIIDAHIHFWHPAEVPDPATLDRKLHTSRFMNNEFARITGGHQVAGLVYIECGSGISGKGDPRFAPVGETWFAAELAREMRSRRQPPILAIAPFADLRAPHLQELLDAHEQAGGGLVRAIRQSGAWMKKPEGRLLAGAAAPTLYHDPAFQQGLATLGERGLPFEAFQFHDQLPNLVTLARQTPGTTIIVNHLGAPIGYGRGDKDDSRVLANWTHNVTQLADLPNVVMKLGGLASPVTEYDAARSERPPGSDTFVAQRGAYFTAAIDAFGPDRCMFESNFPVDSVSISYGVLWNAYKKIASRYSQTEAETLLAGTARRIYALGN
ncbi:amidohydrolase family protein [Aquicoccus porphyridii]|uniref:Amidohydrolase family protein n=1 Tax=Aquicoccus porphyridii TaxID=1852029 RepID=A0A5A9ZCS1_9RHOB|nr:amidohydrolase family protein [Aquicoccus porphyridii]KAA0914951.1 amidohydrolase family protein [Aquicoccus porphyridii]RAI52505.1 amidohydrolase [Rhodobacteraceae bacterium AsT-22]